MTEKQHAQEILRRFKKTYPVRGPFVAWKNPLELLIGTVLSAQTTDKKVNQVTRGLFQKYKTAEDYAEADIATLEEEIYSIGFYRVKAKFLKGIGEKLAAEFHGRVPERLDDLLTLPGVAKKTAHLILAKAFGKMTGIAVDTHVLRLSPRLGLSQNTNPEKIGVDLEKWYDPPQFLEVNEYFITHGRKICVKNPKCSICPVKDLCPSAKKFMV
ncbi:endonuclease III [Candidatus Peregrinibacteria bacterium]|nr:endonuclease III [Candidatus Peregrinibacteria bacterium]